MDISVRVSNLNRNKIIERLESLPVLVNSRYDVEKLRVTLAKNLKKRHPIHKKLKTLTNSELFEISQSLSLVVVRRRDRMLSAISSHFFNEFPDAPLTNLVRILDEDAYFDELTTGIVLNISL